jgi:hypothetical protein
MTSYEMYFVYTQSHGPVVSFFSLHFFFAVAVAHRSLDDGEVDTQRKEKKVGNSRVPPHVMRGR